MKNLISSLLLFFFLCESGFAQKKENSSIKWLTFEQLSDSLSNNPKKVLLFFHTDWCSYCRKMMKETFQDSRIVEKISQEYYAVHFDAESTDTVKFENMIFKNITSSKKAGQFHEIAKILIATEPLVFPTLILFDTSLTPTYKTQKYLSIKELIKIL